MGVLAQARQVAPKEICRCNMQDVQANFEKRSCLWCLNSQKRVGKGEDEHDDTHPGENLAGILGIEILLDIIDVKC